MAAASGSSPLNNVALTSAQVRFLRGLAHDLKAILQVGGKGISESLVAEVENALEQHELIKVKIASEDRETRDAMIGELVQRAGAALVQRIGHTAVLYKPSRDKRQIVLPRG
jgi:RNA-binding protein